MASQKQIDANRPNTAEGKAASCMNALKTGIHPDSQIIRDENPAELEALKSEYFGRFRPTSPEERTLVDTLIDCEWLLRRFRTVEAQLWIGSEPCLDDTDNGKELGRKFILGDEIFLRLQRRIDSTHRNYRRALRDLEQLRRSQPETRPEPKPVTATPCKQDLKPINGFVQ